MMNMRPFQIIVISVFAILALVGLYLFATFKGFSGGAKPVGQVTIWGMLPVGDMNAAIEDLKRSHKEFEKIVYIQHNADTFDSELSDAIASGSGPDLIVTNQEHLMTEKNKLLTIPSSTISERAFRDMYLPINEIYLNQSGTYALPYLVDPLVLYYNRATLSSAGIAQPPTTWEAVLGLTPKFTVKSDANVISKSALPFGVYENATNGRAILSLLLLQSGSTISEYSSSGYHTSLSSGAEVFSQSPGESAISFFTQFADPAKIVYTWSRARPDARSSFLAGDVVFYVGFASERSFIKNANPHLDFDMATVPQPQTAANAADYALAYAFAVPKGSANVSGAVRVAQALTTSEEIKIVGPYLGMASALRADSSSGTDIYSPIINASALRSKGWLSPAPSTTDRIFAGMINAIITGRDSVHDALVSADESLTAALQ